MINEETTRIIEENAQPIHITLTKNTKGYQWEISVFGSDLETMFSQIAVTDSKLRTQYGAVET